MADCCSFIGSAIPLDENAFDAYQTLNETLKDCTDEESFMGAVTDILMIEPSLVNLDNILYIIDDRTCRHRQLLSVSGRQLLQQEIALLTDLSCNPDIAVDYFYDRYNWANEGEALWSPTELISVFFEINHAYKLSFYLRQHVASINNLFNELQQNLIKLRRHLNQSNNQLKQSKQTVSRSLSESLSETQSESETEICSTSDISL